MDFVIHPYQSVGPIRIGMPRDEVRSVLKAKFKSFKKYEELEEPIDSFDSLGVHVYYKSPGVVEAVELFYEPPHTVQFCNQQLTGVSYKEIRDWLITLDPGIDEDDEGLTSRKFGISLYAPDAEDAPEEPTESAMVFEEGYYDR